MILALAQLAFAGPPPQPLPELVLLPEDLPVLIGLAGYSLGAALRPQIERDASPSDPALLTAMDRWALDLDPNEGLRANGLSNLLGTTGALPLTIGFGIVHGVVRGQQDGSGAAGVQQASAFAVVSMETIALNYALNDVVKYAIRRPRPLTYSPDYTGGPLDDELSFYSGHTSTAGTWTFFTAHTFIRTNGWKGWTRVVPYIAASGVTAATGYLRVRAGKHFPTDVITGGLVGATTGILASELHLHPSSSITIAKTTAGWQVGWQSRW